MSSDDVMRGAVRRSSPQPQSREREGRQLLYDSLNERRLMRERVMASLLTCPATRTSGRPHGAGLDRS
jgi:hypothetical protein